jgi:hypothetical protein
MRKKLFYNSDIRKILNIPMRRIVNITDKTLVIPVIDASGAGSKREYSYINLLEFGLIENLFDIGLGIQLVKKIVVALREDGDFKEWAEDFDSYFLKAAEKYISWIEKQQKRHKSAIGSLFDPNNTKDPNIIKNALKPQKPYGILFYTFTKDGYNKKRIVPWEIVIPWDDSNFLAVPFLYEDIVTSKGMITVNLGRIKEDIDKKINEKA